MGLSEAGTFGRLEKRPVWPELQAFAMVSELLGELVLPERVA